MEDGSESLFAEAQIILELFLGTQEAATLFGSLLPEDFSYPPYRAVYQKAYQAYQDQGFYNSAQLLELPAAVAALQQASSQALPGAEVQPFVRRLQAWGQGRRLKPALRQLLRLPAAEIPGALLRLAQETANLRNTATGADALANQRQQQLTSLLAALEEGQVTPSVTSGFAQVDALCGGLRRGHVSVWGARPGLGKTSLLLQVLLANAACGEATLFFSLEMSGQELWERLLANVCQLPYSLLQKGPLPKAAAALCRQTLASLCGGQALFLCDDRPTATAQAAACRQWQPALAVVDYLQLVPALAPAANRNEALAALMAYYKQTARQVGCHIALVSQMNRGEAGEPLAAKRLKDSGSIEEGGDYIFLLQKAGASCQGLLPQELLLVKNKFGPVGKRLLWFDGVYQRFYEEAPGGK